MSNRLLIVLFYFFSTLAFGKNTFSPNGLTAIWDTSTASGILNGPGTWDSNSTFNYDGAGILNSRFCQGCNVAFGKTGSTGSGGTVNMAGPQSINGLIFDPGPIGIYTLSGGPIICTNTTACPITANLNGTISAVISGTKGIRKAGSQTLTLSGINTYSGGTIVSNGNLNLENASAAGANTGAITLGDSNTGNNSIVLTSNYSIANPINVPAVASGTVAINGTTNYIDYSGTLTINRPTTLGGSVGDRYGYSGKITGGPTTLTIAASPRITFDQPSANVSDFTGNVAITSGTLQILSSNALNAANSVAISSGAFFRVIASIGATPLIANIGTLTGAGDVNGNSGGAGASKTLSLGGDNGSGTFSGIISNGSGADTMNITKAGTGTQTFLGSNTYTGVTTVSAGTLELGNGIATGNIIPAINLITNNATLTFNTPSTITHSGIISGTGSLIKKGTGNIFLTGSNTFSGGTTISNGTVTATNTNGMGTGTLTLGDANTGTNNIAWYFGGGLTPANPIVVSNLGTGTVTIGTSGSGTFTTSTGAITFNRPVILNDSTGDRTSFGGKISGNVGTISVTGTRITFGNAGNDFLGNISVGTGSSYQNDSPTALPTTTKMLLNGTGIFRLGGGGTHTIDSLDGPSTSGVTIVTNNVSTLSLGNNNGTGSFAGVISNGSNILSVAKNGTGTQTFTGANTYTGGTTINGGTLVAGSLTAFGTGTITINAGGTLNCNNLQIANTIVKNGTIINCPKIFTAGSGNWTAPSGVTSVLVLVVGGGGAGGGAVNGNNWAGGGGGGAGGYIYQTYTVVPGNSYSYSIGAGGTGTTAQGNNGSNSVFATLTAIGGGGGGQGSTGGATAATPGKNGGSGGGAGGMNAVNSAFGTKSGLQGSDGGPSHKSGTYSCGGGGGGFSGTGLDVATDNGGPGSVNSITGTSVTYSQGGDGQCGYLGNGIAGAANTGNGGGGTGQEASSTLIGASGGSGIVVIHPL